MALVMNGMRPNELMVKKLGMFGCVSVYAAPPTHSHVPHSELVFVIAPLDQQRSLQRRWCFDRAAQHREIAPPGAVSHASLPPPPPPLSPEVCLPGARGSDQG